MGHRSLVLQASRTARSLAIDGLQSIVLRLISTIPPAQLNLTLIDPMGQGRNVELIMQLADHDEHLVNSKVGIESSDIETHLAALADHIERISQNYLVGPYTTLDEYQTHAGKISEPYRILVVLDVPYELNQAAAHHLATILQHGPRCGIYTILLTDASDPLFPHIQTGDLAQLATLFTWEDEHFVWQDEDYRPCRLVLDALPDRIFTGYLIDMVGKAAVEAHQGHFAFERIAPTAETWWSRQSREGIMIPL
ncbi:MAG: hypothetical protein HC837_17690, partial [Chloroflexaceae bacterium]|nr:hypothetical protein [Chloroflexaceae bacterium]